MGRQKWLQNAVAHQVTRFGDGLWFPWQAPSFTDPLNGWMDEWMNWTLDFVVLFVLIEYCDSRHYSFSRFSLYRPRIMPALRQNWLGNSHQVELAHEEATSIQL